MNTSSCSVPVLFVGNFLSASGAPRGVCEELSLRLADRGWPVATTSSRRARLWRLADMLHTIWSRRGEFRVAHVDLYSGHAFLWAEAACALLRRVRKPYVLTLHGGGLPRFAAKNPGRVRRLLESARAVTAPSRYLMAHLAAFHHGTQLIPNAIDVGRYEFRLRAGLRPNLVWLRAFHHIYNPVLAVKAAALLAPEYPDLTLTMVGPDKGDGSLQETRAAASELGIASQVRFVGAVPKSDVPRYIGAGDIFLCTSNVDNTPVTLMEAMACGLPIVSTNASGIPYLAENRREALLVSCGDAAGMANVVRRLLADSGLACRLSAAGRRKAESFDWSTVLPRWEHLLLECTQS